MYGAGEQVQIKHVLLFPPNDSDKILVNLDSLYGTCVNFLSVNAVITFPRVVKLRFIVLASSKVYPVALNICY